MFKFLLKMHVGNPSEPTVEVGQLVTRGECIANPIKLGAKIHSSINGKVIKIDEEAIFIESTKTNSDEYKKIKKCETIAEYAYEAGIVGAGGAGFPTHIKLQTKIPNGFIIANCVECEPSLEHNIVFLEKDSTLVIKGIRYTMEATGATKGYIGIKSKNKKAISETQKVIDKLGYEKTIEIKEVKNIYPMGEERALIHAIFDKWIEAKDLPSTLNCVVMNGETLANLTRAIEDRKPVIDKDFTVVGDFSNKDTSNVYFNLPIGGSIKELTKEYKLNYDLGELVIGGPYTGVAGKLEETYLTKISGGAIFTIPLPKYEGPVGLLVCACGANEERLRDIAMKMNSEVKGVTFCKNVTENKKCNTPGVCPGQAQSVMYLKSQGAKRIIMSNCNDCSNTVMCCAPKLGIGVYHATDHIFRTINYPLSRRMSIED
ncbi:MAG: proline reductase-associated electron transfer protein PrdC [Fusobacteriaceae bacterium]